MKKEALVKKGDEKVECVEHFGLDAVRTVLVSEPVERREDVVL